SAPRRSAGANNAARYLLRSALRTNAAQYLSFSFIPGSLARGLRDGDQSRADAPVFSQKDVVGAHGRAGRHRIDREREIAEALTQGLGQRPRIAAGPDQEEIEGLR